jgi:PHP family Zn ribbon phosphoesterase
MNLLMFECTGCSHTFRRILSDPAKLELPCPECGKPARKAEAGKVAVASQYAPAKPVAPKPPEVASATCDDDI